MPAFGALHGLLQPMSSRTPSFSGGAGFAAVASGSRPAGVGEAKPFDFRSLVGGFQVGQGGVPFSQLTSAVSGGLGGSCEVVGSQQQPPTIPQPCFPDLGRPPSSVGGSAFQPRLAAFQQPRDRGLPTSAAFAPQFPASLPLAAVSGGESLPRAALGRQYAGEANISGQNQNVPKMGVVGSGSLDT